MADSRHKPLASRYDSMPYRRCGRSGIDLPVVALGLWHNFGGTSPFDVASEMILRAFDLGITHFDLANNYGVPPGSAETTFGQVLKQSLSNHRDELFISTKAGWGMWPGRYGDLGSRKHLVSSLEQSLQRLGIAYVDVFYHHRPDPRTPIEETMGALDYVVRSGRALYAGISSYPPELTQQASRILDSLGTPCLVHQPRYSMFDRRIEKGLLDVLADDGIGCVVFSPLEQGLLTSKYLNGVPDDSRAASEHGFLRREDVTEDRVRKASALNDVAAARGQSLAQMAVAWVLRLETVTCALVGASKVRHVEEAAAAANGLEFDSNELASIAAILSA